MCRKAASAHFATPGRQYQTVRTRGETLGGAGRVRCCGGGRSWCEMGVRTWKGVQTPTWTRLQSPRGGPLPQRCLRNTALEPGHVPMPAPLLPPLPPAGSCASHFSSAIINFNKEKSHQSNSERRTSARSHADSKLKQTFCKTNL